MALTAALRTFVLSAITMGLTWLVTRLGIVDLDIAAVADLLTGVVITFGSGAVAYALNKLGSRYSWVNLILSFGRAKSSSVYVPADKEVVEVLTTPPGERTIVTASDSVGKVERVAV